MSEHQNITVISWISFAMGLLVGVVTALFLAPMSGRELRGRVSEEARVDWVRTTDQLHGALADLRQQMEIYDQRIREQISAQMSQLQAKLDKQANPEQSA
jgi:gas vesicle protein